jgi:hypothetical protein
MNRRMVSPLDIERSSHILIRQYGMEASSRALDRLSRFLAKGDREGAQIWLEIYATVDRMLADDPTATRH